MTPTLKRYPVLLVVLLLACIVLSISCGATNGSSGTPSARPTVQHATATLPLPSPTATTVRAWKTVQTFTGTSDETTATFDVSNDWKIIWSCYGITSPAVPGILTVTIDYNGTSSYQIANTACQPQGSSDYREIGGAGSISGSIYLDIKFTGSRWTIQIQELE